jgi:predicted secreted hydrolase
VHALSQRRTPGNASSGTVNSFDFSLGDWSMQGGDGKDRLRFQVGDQRWDLSLRAIVPPVMQGGTGLLDFERTGSSYYYTRPRMHISGTLTNDQGPRQVSGSAWFDHQWGDFEVFELGWDWFALSLEDGRDIMLYRLFDPRDGSSVLTSGTLAENGNTVVLGAEDFGIQATGRWVSPRTGKGYPMGWQIDLPDHGIDLSVSPVMPDSEFDARITTYQVYWEGPVRIGGSHTGIGYVELSGYGAGEVIGADQ